MIVPKKTQQTIDDLQLLLVNEIVDSEALEQVLVSQSLPMGSIIFEISSECTLLGCGFLISSNLIIAIMPKLITTLSKSSENPLELHFKYFSSKDKVWISRIIISLNVLTSQDQQKQVQHSFDLAICSIDKQINSKNYTTISAYKKTLKYIPILKNVFSGKNLDQSLMTYPLNRWNSIIQNHKMLSNHHQIIQHSVNTINKSSGAPIVQIHEQKMHLIGFNITTDLQHSCSLFFDQSLIDQMLRLKQKLSSTTEKMQKAIQRKHQKQKKQCQPQSFEKFIEQEWIQLKITPNFIFIEWKNFMKKTVIKAKLQKEQVQSGNFIVQSYQVFCKVLIDAFETEKESFGNVFKFQDNELLISLGKGRKFINRVAAQSYSLRGSSIPEFFDKKEVISFLKEYLDNYVLILEQKSRLANEKNRQKVAQLQQKIKTIFEQTKYFCQQFTKSFIKESNKKLDEKIDETVSRFNNLQHQFTGPLKKIDQFLRRLESKLQSLSKKVYQLQRNYQKNQQNINKQIVEMNEILKVEESKTSMINAKFDEQISYLMKQMQESNYKLKNIFQKCEFLDKKWTTFQIEFSKPLIKQSNYNMKNKHTQHLLAHLLRNTERQQVTINEQTTDCLERISPSKKRTRNK